MTTRFSIVTLIIFILSITFVIYPVSFTLRLPYLGRRKIPIDLATAPILAIAILWASQCLGATQVCLPLQNSYYNADIFQIRDGIVGTGQELASFVFRIFLDTVSRWRQAIQHSYSILHPCLHGHYTRRIRTSSSRRVLGQQ